MSRRLRRRGRLHRHVHGHRPDEGRQADDRLRAHAGDPRGRRGEGRQDLDGREIYTLSFDGRPQKQGYHVKVDATTLPESKANDAKSKTFWVGPCTTGGATTDPGTGGGTTDPGTATDPTDPDTGGDTTDPDMTAPFDWNWKYAAPTCAATTVTYPSNLPSGQANDANIRFRSATAEFTLNFHEGSDTRSGIHAFIYADHPNGPAGLTAWDVVWVQVAGTNYHWQGDVVRPVVVVPRATCRRSTGTGLRRADLTALNVIYPSNIPSGQANDANIRFESNVGQFTLNFDHETGTWSGEHSFNFTTTRTGPPGSPPSVLCGPRLAAPISLEGRRRLRPLLRRWTRSRPPAPAVRCVPVVRGFDTDDVMVRGAAPWRRAWSRSAALPGLVLERLQYGSWSQVSDVFIYGRLIAPGGLPRLAKRGNRLLLPALRCRRRTTPPAPAPECSGSGSADSTIQLPRPGST